MNLLVSTKLPSYSDIQGQVDALTQQLSDLTMQAQSPESITSSYSPQMEKDADGNDVYQNAPDTYKTVQGRIDSVTRQLYEKQSILASLRPKIATSSVSGIPSDAPLFGPRIAAQPKVGFSDLLIKR